jgi:hypothetical protein
MEKSTADMILMAEIIIWIAVVIVCGFFFFKEEKTGGSI